MKKTKVNTGIVRFVFYLILLSCLINDVYSQATCIERVEKEEENWCWAACCEMALECFGVSWSQSEIADWAVDEDDIGNSFVGSAPGADHSISEVYSEKGITHSHKEYDPTIFDVEPQFSDIKEEIVNNNRPVHVGIDATPYAHSVIVTDIVTDGVGDLKKYICVDPDPEENMNQP